MPIGRTRYRVCTFASVCSLFFFLFTSSRAAGQPATAVPSPWATSDIGSPVPAGQATFGQGLFRLTGGGADIGGTSDQFRFVYQAITGDVDIVARVNSIVSNTLAAKAGVMIRGALTANAPHAFVTVPADKGIAFQRRPQTGGSTLATAGGALRAPVWLRLVRTGTTVTAMFSSDGMTWTTIGSDTVALDATAYVGLAVTSRNPGANATADISNVAVTSVSLPTGQQSGDVGNPALRGNTTQIQGVYAITGAGADIWDTRDQFQFAYQAIAGDVDVSARIVSLTKTDEWTKVGLMVRESLSADARYAMTAVTAEHGYVFQRRIDSGGFSESVSGGANATPAWIRLVRSGSNFEAFRSVDGKAWVSFARDTVPMGETVYVGIAVTSHVETRPATAVVDSYTVTRSTATPNRPPVVTLNSPVSGIRYTAPATITLSATATDPEGRLARVDFYSGANRIGTDSTAPFTVNWTGVGIGTYSIIAVAIDADGAVASSPAATIDVAAATTTPPPTTTPTPTPVPPPTTPPAPTTPPPGPTTRPPATGPTTTPTTPTPTPAPTPTSPPAPAPPPPVVAPPAVIVFTVSAGHALVKNYRLDIYAAGANPAVAAPIATSDLGKPSPDTSGDVTVDRTAFFAALQPGSYLATVTAVGSSGSLGEGHSVPVVVLR